MWQVRRISSLNSNFRWKSSINIKDVRGMSTPTPLEKVVNSHVENYESCNEKLPFTKKLPETNMPNKAILNLAKNLKKLKEKNGAKNAKTRTIKGQAQNKNTQKIIHLDEVYETEDKHYRTSLIKCFTDSCHSKFFSYAFGKIFV